MAKEKKNYLMNLLLEVVTDDGETVKAIHIHRIDNEPTPLVLWCDVLDRLRSMMPDESVLFVGGSSVVPKTPIEKGKGYIIKKDSGDFITGDYFEGVSNFELKHCRSGQVVRVSRETMKDFLCVGDYDESMVQPILPECMEMIEKVKKDYEQDRLEDSASGK